jgi:hypothetical protein
MSSRAIAVRYTRSTLRLAMVVARAAMAVVRRATAAVAARRRRAAMVVGMVAVRRRAPVGMAVGMRRRAADTAAGMRRRRRSPVVASWATLRAARETRSMSARVTITRMGNAVVGGSRGVTDRPWREKRNAS